MWKIKEWFLHYKEAIRVSLLALFRWTLLAVCTGVLCGGIGTLFHLAVEWVTEQRMEHVWLLWLLPAAGIAITALYKATGCVGKGTNDVLRAVQDGSCALAILCCGTGVGISMCANKMKGIRACCCSDTFSAELTRRHNNANALCMGGRVVGAGLACKIVDAFLNAEFEGGRHQTRIDKMMALENL